MNRNLKQRNSRGSIAELVPALFILLFVLFFPFIDLISFISAVITVNSVAQITARSAARATTFSEAERVTAQTAEHVAQLGRFYFNKPIGGVNNKGVTLLVEVHRIPHGTDAPVQITTIEPSKSQRIEIDRSKYIYFYRTIAKFEVLPIFNFAGSPTGLSEIAGLGKPVLLQYSSSATIEHPEGLNERDDTHIQR